MLNRLPLFAFVLLTAAAALSFKSGSGGTVPSVQLKHLDGQTVDLKSLPAQADATVISFWATWCVPCKKELDNINELLGTWKEKYNMQLVAVSVDDSRNSLKVKPFVRSKGWDFTVLLDVNGDTQRSLNFVNVPYTLLVDKEGNIVYKHVGYTEGDEQVLEKEIKKLTGK